MPETPPTSPPTPPTSPPTPPSPKPTPPAPTNQSPPVFRDGRLWTAWLWAFIVSLALASLTAASQQLSNQAAERSALVLPIEDFGESERKTIKEEIAATPGVAKVIWLSPQRLAQRTSSAISRDLWRQLLLDDEGWLPWIAEVDFEDPITDPEAVQSTVSAIRKNEKIQLVLWDKAALEKDFQSARRVSTFSTGLLLIVLGLGSIALALARSAPRAAWWKWLLLAPFPASLVLIHLLFLRNLGLPLSSSNLALGSTVAFILAGVIAPMLIQRNNFNRNGATPTK